MTPPRDSDLMQLADGELDPTTAATVEASMGATERAKVAALRDLGEAVRGHLELGADAASPRLARLWDEIDKRITIAEKDRTPVPEAAPRPAAAAPGFWGRLGRWLDDHRSHVLTGVLSAGAVAAVALFLRPGPDGVRTVYVTAPTNGAGGPAAPTAPTLVRSTPPVVESLEVTGGTGTVFTIEDEDGGTAVIWVTPEDTVEGL